MTPIWQRYRRCFLRRIFMFSFSVAKRFSSLSIVPLWFLNFFNMKSFFLYIHRVLFHYHKTTKSTEEQLTALTKKLHVLESSTRLTSFIWKLVTLRIWILCNNYNSLGSFSFPSIYKVSHNNLARFLSFVWTGYKVCSLQCQKFKRTVLLRKIDLLSEFFMHLIGCFLSLCNTRIFQRSLWYRLNIHSIFPFCWHVHCQNF